MRVNLHAKFEVSSIILTSFRHEVVLPAPPQNEPLKSPPGLGLIRWLCTQKHYILDAWTGSEYIHHNIHLMGYFEFLHGSRVICLPLNISENCIDHISSKSQKRQWLIAFILVNTMQYPRISIYHSNRWGPPPFFHWDTNPVLGHVIIHSDKTHVLVVTVELIWLLFLNILSFNFVPTPSKSLPGWQDSEEAM